MFEVGKVASVKLSDSNRIVLAHLCEDCKIEPSIAINRLIETAILCGIDSPDLCEESLDAINRAFTESISELADVAHRHVLEELRDTLNEWLGKE